MPHTPQHKKKKFTTVPEDVPATEANKLRREAGDKTPRSNITGEDLSVGGTLNRIRESRSKQRAFLEGQLQSETDPIRLSRARNELGELNRFEEQGNVTALEASLIQKQEKGEPQQEEEGKGFFKSVGAGVGFALDPLKEGPEVTNFVVPFPIGAPGGNVTGGLLGVNKIKPGQDPRVIISSSASRHITDTTTGQQFPRGTKFHENVFTPKPGSIKDSNIDKLFKAGPALNRNTAKRFPVNAKSAALTKSWLAKLGFNAAGLTALYAAFGTYPWAAHNNREATESLTFGLKGALNAGDTQQYDILAAEFDEMVENMPNAWIQLPGKNVVDSSVQGINNAILVKNSFDSQREKLERR